jgi:hypothetical protein
MDTAPCVNQSLILASCPCGATSLRLSGVPVHSLSQSLTCGSATCPHTNSLSHTNTHIHTHTLYSHSCSPLLAVSLYSPCNLVHTHTCATVTHTHSHIYIHTHTHTNTNVRTHTHTHTRTHTHTYAYSLTNCALTLAVPRIQPPCVPHTFECTSTQVRLCYTHTHTPAHMHTHIYTNTRAKTSHKCTRTPRPTALTLSVPGVQPPCAPHATLQPAGLGPTQRAHGPSSVVMMLARLLSGAHQSCRVT